MRVARLTMLLCASAHAQQQFVQKHLVFPCLNAYEVKVYEAAKDTFADDPAMVDHGCIGEFGEAGFGLVRSNPARRFESPTATF